MAVEDLSLLRFGVINFFAVLMNRPIYLPSQALLCEIVHSIIEAETTPNQDYKDRVKYLYEYTHEKIEVSLTTVENVVFRNMNKGLSTEVTFDTKRGGRSKNFTVAELIRILSNIRWELVTIVTKIIKKYTMEVPMFDIGAGGNIKMGFNLGMQDTGINPKNPK